MLDHIVGMAMNTHFLRRNSGPNSNPLLQEFVHEVCVLRKHTFYKIEFCALLMGSHGFDFGFTCY